VPSASGGGPSWLSGLAGNQAGEVLNRLGRPLEAQEALARALETLEQLDPGPPGSDALRARILATGGVACFRTGEIPAALDRFGQAVALFESSGARKEVSITRLHLANAYTLLARYPEAEALFREGAQRSGSPKGRADALCGLGLILQYQGRQDEALEALLGALAAHEAAGDTAGAARDRMNLAAVHLNRDRIAAAREQYEIALALCREPGRTADQGFALAGLGLTSLRSGRLDQAEAELQSALETLASCPCPSERAVAHELYGRVELRQGRDRDAASHFTAARDLALSTGRRETLWRAHAGLGDVASGQGDLQAAADHYLRSVEAIESVRDGLQEPDLRESYLYDKLHVYNALVRTLLLRNEKYGALEGLNRRNQWLASRWLGLTPSFDSPRRSESCRTGRALTARVSAIRETLRGAPEAGEQGSPGWVQALRDRMEAADRELQAYLADLRDTDPALHGRLAGRPLDMRGLSGRLPDDVAVVAYFLDGEDLHAFSLTGGALQVAHRPRARGRIEQAAAGMREAVRRPPSPRDARETRASFQEASRALHELLIEPLAPAVRGKPSWYVLPDEALWEVAFGALLGGGAEDARYLAQDHRITLVNTLEDVPAGRGAGLGAPGGAPGALRVAAFGDPEQTLPAAAQELGLLRGLDPGARIFTGQEATEQNARRFSRDADILVFATHANRPPASDSAHICLAPSGGEDGRLTAREIRGWDLAHVDLVVLSGCGTALSFDRERTFLSLADAFLFAGAGAVLATLWDISDPGTQRFMERFVHHWGRTGDHARALRLAQNECIEDRTGPPARVSPALRNRYVRVSDLEQAGDPRVLLDMSHPYYWASFVLIEYGPASSARPSP